MKLQLSKTTTPLFVLMMLAVGVLAIQTVSNRANAQQKTAMAAKADTGKVLLDPADTLVLLPCMQPTLRTTKLRWRATKERRKSSSERKSKSALTSVLDGRSCFMNVDGKTMRTDFLKLAAAATAYALGGGGRKSPDSGGSAAIENQIAIGGKDEICAQDQQGLEE